MSLAGDPAAPGLRVNLTERSSTTEMADILAEIATYKREFVQRAKYETPPAEMKAAALDTSHREDFLAALQGEGMALIAEIKKASPSRGVIREDFDAEAIAAIYAENGARALSVLTDEAYFQGSNAYLTAARRISGLPVLRKDFTIDPYQIYEARLIGADAILLIVALMDGGQFDDFIGLGEELDMAVLVEVHSAEELRRSLQVGARLVGINNRNLKTFETTLDTTYALVELIPDNITTVSESGIEHGGHVRELEAAGIDAVLVGESLMKADDMGAKVRELVER